MTQDPYGLHSLRVNAWHFISGRLLSGLLSFAILMLLVRELSVAQFGAYVSLVAGMELVIGIAGLGLPWVVARYLPELRLKGSRSDVVHLVRASTFATLASLATGAGIVLAGFGLFPEWTQGAWADYRVAVLVFVGVGMLEGLTRHLRDNILGGLMMQARARACITTRQGLLLGGLLVMVLRDDAPLDIRAVVAIECAACGVALLVALIQVRSAVRDVSDPAAGTPLRPPSFITMWATGLRMFAAQLASMPYQPAAVLLMLQQYSGLEAAALFGFLKSIYEQLCRYLPTALLFAVIRPKLVAAAVSGASRSHMLAMTGFVSRLGLLAAMPVIALAAVAGPAVLFLLSGGRFEEAAPVVLVMTLLVVLYGRRQLLEVCAVAVGASGACLSAAVLSLGGFALAWFLLAAGAGVWGAIAGLACGQVIFTSALQWMLANDLFDLPGLWVDLKILMTGIVAALVALAPLAQPTVGGASMLALQGVLTVLVVSLIAWRFSPFPAEDRSRINAFLGRRLLP